MPLACAAPPDGSPPEDEHPPAQDYDQVTFLSDVTLPDHSIVSPGASLIKTWKVRNNGTSPWNGYKLIFVSGDKMGASSPVDIPYTAVGAEREISIPIIAPQTSARGDWQIVNPSGTWVRNGQLWVILNVPGTTPVTTSDIDLDCVNNTCYATVTPGQTFRPTIRAKINSGDLVGSRGDMLLHVGDSYYTDFPHIGVVGSHSQGSIYDFQFYADHPIVAPQQEGTYESKWRVWRNGNWAGEEYTIHFTVSQTGGNRPPNRPTLTGPGDWAVYQGTQVVLTAQHNGDPDGDAVNEYYFDLRGAAPRNSGWIASNTWSPADLPFNGYEWQVKVRDAQENESDWSEQTWHFSVLNNNPEIYSFSSTTCREAWGGAEKTCFCAKTNAGTLKLMINTASDGSTNGEWHGIDELGVPEYRCETDSDRPPNLDPLPYTSGTHVVRLYARRDGGWENAAYRDITLNLPAERRPNWPPLRYPLNYSYVNTSTIRFDWEDSQRVTEAAAYRLEVSDGVDFSNLLLTEIFPRGTTEYVYTFTTDYETVYWRVIGMGPYGTNQSDWRFHIDRDAPTSSITALPPITFDTKFTLNWAGSDARSGLRWYHLQMRDVSRPGSGWEDWLVNTTLTAEIFQGQPGHTYAFRVRAMDAIGNWEDWPAGDNGDMYTQVDPSAAPPTAWWDASYAQKRNLVILNNDSDTLPTDFPVQIHFDASTTPPAAEIYNASLAATKGDDVRVVYHNQTEVHRFVQRFTPDQIDLWFPLLADLGGGQTDSGSYQIYYGNAGASNPPADVNTVFLPKTDSNTMGLWHFQEGSGSTVNDSSGHSHNASFASAGWGDGYLGGAGLFNGSDSVLNVGSHSDFNNLTAFTIEGWLYTTRSGWAMPFIKGHNGYAQFSARINGDNDLEFMVTTASSGSKTLISTEKIQPNRWYHLALVHDGGSNQWIFINGSQRGNKSDSAPMESSSDPFYIGYAPWWSGTAFPGYMQHVRVSNIARTDFPYARVDIPPQAEAGISIAPPTPGAPDLAILNLATYPNIGGGLLVLAQVENQGDAPTQNNFYTDLYVDHLPTGAGDYTGTLQFWVNSPIAAGAQVTLTTVITDLAGLGGRMARALAAPGSEVTATLYTQVDSVGVISETDNANNISAGVEICLASADAYEGDDDIAGASVMALGQTQSHNFDSLADRDWMQFEAQGGVTYTLRTFDLSNGADTYLYLYASDGVSLTLLAANDDYGGSLASQIDWIAPMTGTYYLLAQHWNPNVGGCGTGYKLAVNIQSAVQKIYLPLVVRAYSPAATPRTLTVYATSDDGEVGNINCATWNACRESLWGNLALTNYANATVESNYYSGTYAIKRAFFYFDTTALPAAAVIQSVTVNIYAGPFQTESPQRLHVVAATQAAPLTNADFGRVAFVSGGFADAQVNTWLTIPLNATGQTWLVKGGMTRLALLNDLDLHNVIPTEASSGVVATADDTTHRPYLTIQYVLP